MKRLLFCGALLACGSSSQAAWPYREGSPAIAPSATLVLDDSRPPRKCCLSPSEKARSAGLPVLSSVQLPAGDVEVRFWVVPSFGSARGVVLRTTGSDSHALVLDKRGSRAAAPSRAWDGVWEALMAEGILTLPDDSSLPSDGKYIVDGVGYVVEVQHDGVYRSYAYSNPADHAWPEATHVLRIAHVLARAFRVPIDDRSANVRARVPDVDVDTTSRAIGAACDSLDMTQSSRCGPNGRIAIALEHGARAACDPKPLPAPNPYAWSACVTRDRVYLSSETTVLVADVAEMSDDQRLGLQKKLGISKETPLRTIGEWRTAMRY